MDKNQFLQQIEKNIKPLGASEQREVLDDYEEYFEMGYESGRTDEDIIKGLGSPAKIAKEILAQTEITKAEEDPSLTNVFRAVAATLGLGLFNLIFVLAPFIVLLLWPFVMIVISGAFLISPILLLIQDGLTINFLKDIFLIFGLVGLGLLLLVGSIKSSRIVYKLILRYLTYNLRIIRRRYS
ncbi:HAAS signaling domain-containing protein [Fictibacillus phosphorivorans]|uniref:HAAS signaling domain-containing protein n=1 Tax=Fictibacillus TaxID=1329200 RepID=UPI0018CEB2F9|nr:DUF1700 domain-containing protein [Fictibacillus sp. 23RED33]